MPALAGTPLFRDCLITHIILVTFALNEILLMVQNYLLLEKLRSILVQLKTEQSSDVQLLAARLPNTVELFLNQIHLKHLSLELMT